MKNKLTVFLMITFLSFGSVQAFGSEPVAWSDLNAQQHMVLARFETAWAGFKPEKQQRLLNVVSMRNNPQRELAHQQKLNAKVPTTEEEQQRLETAQAHMPDDLQINAKGENKKLIQQIQNFTPEQKAAFKEASKEIVAQKQKNMPTLQERQQRQALKQQLDQMTKQERRAFLEEQKAQRKADKETKKQQKQG